MGVLFGLETKTQVEVQKGRFTFLRLRSRVSSPLIRYVPRTLPSKVRTEDFCRSFQYWLGRFAFPIEVSTVGSC